MALSLYLFGMQIYSKRVTKLKVKQVMLKQVTISVLVVKQKQEKPHPKPEHRGKDGREIGVRRAASSGFQKKEQKWTDEAINKCFVMCEQNKDLPPEQKKSKRQIVMECEVSCTTVCERLSGRRGGGPKGKIAGRRQKGKVLNTSNSKQVIKQVIFHNILAELIEPITHLTSHLS